MSIRAYAYIAIALLLGLALWRGGVALYHAGAASERAVWEAAKAKDEAESRRAEQGATVASEAAADTSRAEAGAAVADVRGTTTETIETIRYVYRDQPAPACPAPAVPDGVRDALHGAYDAAAAASR